MDQVTDETSLESELEMAKTDSRPGTSYAATFRNFKTGQCVVSQILGHIVAPVAVGIALAAKQISISGEVLPQVLSGLAILTGFLFTLLVFIFQLRLQAGDHEVYKKRAILLRLIDEMNAQTTWAVGVALTLVFGLLIGISVRTDDQIQVFAGAVLSALVVHVFAVMATCAFRAKSAYTEMIRFVSNDDESNGGDAKKLINLQSDDGEEEPKPETSSTATEASTSAS